MTNLADFLATLAVIDRPVVDQTGISGAYTFTLDSDDSAPRR